MRSKSGLRASSSGISYTRALEILKAGMKPFLGNDFKFGSHSFRSGAATVAMASGLNPDAIDAISMQDGVLKVTSLDM